MRTEASPEYPQITPQPNDGIRSDPHKAVVDALWDRLPDPVKAAVAAMVRAAVK
jgi:hypothetical protein